MSNAGEFLALFELPAFKHGAEGSTLACSPTLGFLAHWCSWSPPNLHVSVVSGPSGFLEKLRGRLFPTQHCIRNDSHLDL